MAFGKKTDRAGLQAVLELKKCRLFKRSGDTAAVYSSGERTQPVRSDLGKECIRIVTDRRGCGRRKRV